MSSKVLLFTTLCVLCSCWGSDVSTQSNQDIPMQPLEEADAEEPIEVELNPTNHRLNNTWNIWKIFSRGLSSLFNKPLMQTTESDEMEHYIHRDRREFTMFYVDTQRTVTRRESSLIFTNEEGFSARVNSASRLNCESTCPPWVPQKGTVRRELVTMMFESMLSCIVESWEVISPAPSESAAQVDVKTQGDLTDRKPKKAISPATYQKGSKMKKSRSKMEMVEQSLEQSYPIYQSWWSSPDERAIIIFKNGNVYEGSISMKSMNGEGRFQWADGTAYLGQFKDNEIKGKGHIQWKDDTWYEGDFVGNLRHGKGIYVDSRGQRSYTGEWYCGTKHGHGTIYYNSSFNNNYDGQWKHNVRHGFGSREYCDKSGYRGEWDQYVREGRGLMMWPNHDFYRGGWKNGVMSGYGTYIWEAYENKTMTLPSITSYRGMWERGERSGYGVLNLGFGLGSHYKGEFKNNKKHGVGTFVTNNGLILHDKKLFIDDNIESLGPEVQNSGDFVQDPKRRELVEPYQFNICDDSAGLLYHIEMALKNIDRQAEFRKNIIDDFFEYNRRWDPNYVRTLRKCRSSFNRRERSTISRRDRFDRSISRKDFSPVDRSCSPNPRPAYTVANLEEIIQFEEISLRKSLRCYQTELNNIYYKYATICTTEEIYFTPVMTRLYMWQFFTDCNVQDKGLNLIAIDRMFHENPEWISRNAHDPFEKIYFWQFLHILITVARRLYAKTVLPGSKPDTIMASAFRLFMDLDVLPGIGRRKGRLSNGCGSYIPLRGAYNLYRCLGEPHTVRKFLCAARRPPHYLDRPQPPIVDASDKIIPIGRNTYAFADEITYLIDEPIAISDENFTEQEGHDRNKLELFNIGNLSSKTIIEIFSNIFPQMYKNDKILDLDVELSFFEFFEAFVLCVEEGIRIKDEEMRWREKFSVCDPQSPTRPTHTSGAAQK